METFLAILGIIFLLAICMNAYGYGENKERVVDITNFIIIAVFIIAIVTILINLL